MDFLIDNGISKDVIVEIEDYNDDSLVYNFICNEANAVKVLEYFKSIEIEAINRLLIYKLEVFLIDYKSIVKAFNNYDVSVLVQLINDDINAINFL